MSTTSMWHTFTAGKDIQIGQQLYAAWSADESEIVMFPVDDAHPDSIAIAFGPAKKGQKITVPIKGKLPPKPSEQDTRPNEQSRK